MRTARGPPSSPSLRNAGNYAKNFRGPSHEHRCKWLLDTRGLWKISRWPRGNCASTQKMCDFSKTFQNVGGRPQQIRALRFCSTKRCRTLSKKKTTRTFAATSRSSNHHLKKFRPLGTMADTPKPSIPVLPCVGNKRPRIIALYRLESAEAWVTLPKKKKQHRTDQSSRQPKGHPSSDLTRCPTHAPG